MGSRILFVLMVCLANEGGGQPGPRPTQADVSYGSHPHQLLDVYLPPSDRAPFPVLLWFGGRGKVGTQPMKLGFFQGKGIAVIAVRTRTLEDAMADGEPTPISYVQMDATRAVQFVRHHAAKWRLDPSSFAAGGEAQGALPALFVGCSAERKNPFASDPVERESSLVTCVAGYRAQTTLDPLRIQDWAPGVTWDAPALGCSFEESLRRRDELMPMIRRWSPDHLLDRDHDVAPIFLENDWGLTKPNDVVQADYDLHSPRWALGFQRVAQAAETPCYVRFPGHLSGDDSPDLSEFIFRRLRP